MPKYLLIFEKNEPVRWLGHLDILRTFERAIRRSGLPIAFTGGFNPRERLAFAAPLSTGMTGGAEPAVLELTAPLASEEIIAALNTALPPGIRIRTCREIPDAGARDLLNAYDRAVYEVVCASPQDCDAAAIEAAVEALMAQPQICLQREREGRTKTVDVRPLLHALRLAGHSPQDGRCTLEMVVSQGEGGTGKPVEIVAALAEHLPGLALRRAGRVGLFRKEQPIV